VIVGLGYFDRGRLCHCDWGFLHIKRACEEMQVLAPSQGSGARPRLPVHVPPWRRERRGFCPCRRPSCANVHGCNEVFTRSEMGCYLFKQPRIAGVGENRLSGEHIGCDLALWRKFRCRDQINS
jgi:hypothetical protein